MSIDLMMQASPTSDAPQPGDQLLASRVDDLHDLRRRILSVVYDQTESAPRPPVWANLPRSQSVRCLRCTRSELAATLQQSFSDAELHSSRVIKRLNDGDIGLNKVFASAPTTLLFIGSLKDGFDDLFACDGAFTFPEPPGLYYAAASFKTEASKPIQSVLLAADDAQAHVLHQLGLHCKSSAGLERITGKDIPRIFRTHAIPTSSHAYQLTLAAWDAVNLSLDVPPQINAVLARLAQAEKLYNIDAASRFKVWLPSKSFVGTVKSALDFCDSDVVRKQLATSLDHSVYSSAEATRRLQPATQASMASARSNLRQALAREPLSPSDIRVAANEFRLVFDKTVLRKFFDRADSAKDQCESFLLLAGAELTETWFEGQELMAAAQRGMSMRAVELGAALSSEQIDERLRIIGAFSQIQKALLMQRRS
jgi:hypothetical protein